MYCSLNYLNSFSFVFHSLLGKRAVQYLMIKQLQSRWQYILWICVSYPMYSAHLWYTNSSTLHQNKSSWFSNAVMLFHSPVKYTDSKKVVSSDKCLFGCFLFYLVSKRRNPAKVEKRWWSPWRAPFPIRSQTSSPLASFRTALFPEVSAFPLDS